MHKRESKLWPWHTLLHSHAATAAATAGAGCASFACMPPGHRSPALAPEHVVDRDDAAGAHQPQQLLKVARVPALVRICALHATAFRSSAAR